MEISEILQLIKGRRILVLGDVMLDHYVWGDATRISPEAPVPVVDVFRDSYAAGGAANVALNLAALGASPCLAGWIGEDEAGVQLTKILADHGVDFPEFFQSPSKQTIRKTRIMVQSQQLCRIDREGPSDDYGLDAAGIWEQLKDKVSVAAAVVLSDYGKGGVTDRLFSLVRESADKAGILVSLDPKPRRRLAFQGVDLLTPNRSEALQLAGLEPAPHERFPAEEVCRRIWETYQPRYLVVTLGADGVLLSENGKLCERIPTHAREVFDVSGAGDTMIATLTLALNAGAGLADAARFANVAAGVVVGKVGTATVQPGEILREWEKYPQ